MNIERHSGKVTLPNGFSFDSSLTETQFLAQDFDAPKSTHNPDADWFYYPFVAGEIESHPLHLNLWFYQYAVISFEFWVSFHPEMSTWKDFSYPIEQEAQKVYARHLRQWFGSPHDIRKISFLTDEYPVLSEILSWEFPWGKAWCGHDERGGGTSASARYKENWRRATEDDQRRRKSSPPLQFGIKTPRPKTNWFGVLPNTYALANWRSTNGKMPPCR